MSHRALGDQFKAVGIMADEIEDSLVPEHSPEGESSREGWVYNLAWPHKYLEEVADDPNYQEMLHGNLRRMGFGDTVRVRRRGEPRGPITNVSADPNWEGKISSGEMHEWEVPLEHVVGFGHPQESELFVRHPNTEDK